MPLALKPPECQGCPAASVGLGYVPGRGPKDARWALLGQGPGEQEAYRSQPWIGPAGQRLRRWCSRAGIEIGDVWLDNTVRCWLVHYGPDGRPWRSRLGRFKDRAPTAVEAAECQRRHLLPQLRKLPLIGLTPIGVPAMRTWIDSKAGEGWAGMLTTVELGGELDGG